MLDNEVFVMELKEPKVLLILLRSPMAFFEIFRLLIGVILLLVIALNVFVASFLFVFVEVIDLTFLSEKALEIISGLNFMLMIQEDAVRIGEESVGFGQRVILNG